MKRMMRNVSGALLGLSLAACGPALEEEAGPQQQQQALEANCSQLGTQITAHACAHSSNPSDHVSVTATSGYTSGTPGISTVHKHYDVTLPSGLAGTVKFQPSATGSWAFYLTKNIGITVRNSSGTVINPVLGHTVSTSCGLLKADVYDLTSGIEYRVELGSASDNTVGVVAERLEDNRVRHYRDADGDTFGDKAIANSLYIACAPPSGYVLNKFDCNDANASIHPNATEITGNGVDENCNGSLSN